MVGDKTERAWQKLLYPHLIIVLKAKQIKKQDLLPTLQKQFTFILQCRQKKLIFHLSQGSVIAPFLGGRGNKQFLTILGTSRRGSTTAGGEKRKRSMFSCVKWIAQWWYLNWVDGNYWKGRTQNWNYRNNLTRLSELLKMLLNQWVFISKPIYQLN